MPDMTRPEAGTSTKADTGLAVWFEKRDRQWLKNNENLMFSLWVLLGICIVASVFQAIMYGGNRSSLMLAASVVLAMLGIVGNIGLNLLFVYACLARLAHNHPPAELLAGITESQFLSQVRHNAIWRSGDMSVKLILPYGLANLVPALVQESANGMPWVAAGFIQLLGVVVIATIYTLICVGVHQYCMRLHLMLRITLALLALLLSLVLPAVASLLYPAVLDGFGYGAQTGNSAGRMIMLSLLNLATRLAYMLLLFIPVLRLPRLRRK